MIFQEIIRTSGMKVAGYVSEAVLAFCGLLVQLIPEIPEGDTEAQNWVLYGLGALLFARAFQVIWRTLRKK